MRTITRLKSRILHRCSFASSYRSCYEGNIVILAPYCLSFIVRKLRSNEDRRIHLPMLRIDFPIQTNGTYFSSSDMNATAASSLSFRDLIELCIVFTDAKLERLLICARLFQLPSVARILKREWEREGRLG